MGGRLGVKNDFLNLFYRLVAPTILFSTLIYLPKMIFHKGSFGLGTYLFDVFGGISFWFTSALAVAQCVLLLLLMCRVRTMWKMIAITAVVFGIALYFSINDGRVNEAAKYFPWYYRTALVYTFVMSLGGLYYQYEKAVDKVLKKWWIVPAVIYVAIIVFTWESRSIKCLGLGGVCNLWGFVAMVASTLLLIMITKRMKHYKWLEFIGRNSIVFYFFSGAVPAVCGTVIAKLGGADKSYLLTIVVAVLSLMVSYVAAYVIERYLPFLLDFRKLRKFKIFGQNL